MTTKIISYVFPFCIPAKERERARAVKRGKKWVGTVYSPESTKKAYLKIRTYMTHHYPHYINQQINYDVKATVILGITKNNNNADLDNHFKMVFDSLLPDKSRKNSTGFKGIYKDDKYIKEISGKFEFVENVEDEFTKLIFEPFYPSSSELNREDDKNAK
jgi:Holliday junction resolvase RusA-like endonuclease